MSALRPRYELFDHTADLGVRVWAPSLPELVRPATDALYAVIGDVLSTTESRPLTLTFAGDEPALLLRDYLAELLHLFEHEHRRLRPVTVGDFSAHQLVVAGTAALIDEAASVFEREVKAVTYHELAIRAIAGGFEATYIVDI